MTVSSIFFKTPMQARTFLLLLISGMASGILLSILRWARNGLPRSVSAACDAVFCLLVTSLCALALSAGGEGQMRWYAILGMLSGCSLSVGFIHLCEKAVLFLLHACRKDRE